MRGNLSSELQKLNGNFGFIKYCLAKALVVSFNPFVGSIHPPPNFSQIIEARKAKKRMHKSQMKKMYRWRQNEERDNWKGLWEKDKRILKESRNMEYVQTLFGLEPKILNPFGYPPPEVIGNPYAHFELRDSFTGKLFVKPKPMNLRILGLIFILRAYFMRLTKANSKKGKGHPCWPLIADLLAYISSKDKEHSETELSSWWKKVAKIYEIWNEEVILDSWLDFYQKNKDELDRQCEMWLMKHSERYQEDPLETDSKTTFSAEKWLSEGDIIKKQKALIAHTG